MRLRRAGTDRKRNHRDEGGDGRIENGIVAMIVVVMGVSGCGKSTVGAALARALGWPFIEADDLHPAANVAKMSAGIPLDDSDRWPWLDRIVDALRSAQEQ